MQKTPDKSERSDVVDEKTPEKTETSTAEENKNICTSLKDVEKHKSSEFRTPEKATANLKPLLQSPVDQIKVNRKTPEKKEECLRSTLEHVISFDGEDEMISTTEQARLLIAASKTPSKSVNKTPAKQRTPSGKRSIESSPGTPGKFRRVELITLASPKAKLIKEL